MSKPKRAGHCGHGSCDRIAFADGMCREHCDAFANPTSPGGRRMRYGVDEKLEEAADALLKASFEGQTFYERSDILTEWKYKDRKSRELYNTDGHPDSSVRSGMSRRSNNSRRPDLNARDGLARFRVTDGKGLARTDFKSQRWTSLRASFDETDPQYSEVRISNREEITE